MAKYLFGGFQRCLYPVQKFQADAGIFMLEPKRRSEMADVEVVAKKEAAVKWCGLATDHALTNGGKPWKYVLIFHDTVAR